MSTIKKVCVALVGALGIAAIITVAIASCHEKVKIGGPHV